MATITITFGEVCENHVGNQQIGSIKDKGYTPEELDLIFSKFAKKGYECQLYDLTALIEEDISLEPAELLVVKNGVKYFTEPDDLFEALKPLPWDTKAKMRGRVVNKRARYNLCFADQHQAPNYENGEGTIIAFNEVEQLNKMRSKLPKILSEKSANLFAEGNYYYDVKKTYIGFHGDAERRIVLACRLGESFPLSYQWYHRSKPVGDRFDVTLGHGDLYVMSEKAVGNDWKKSSKYTLRHAAGFNV